MKGRMYYYKDLYERKYRDRAKVTKEVILILRKEFRKKMGYPAEQIIARHGEVAKDARDMVTQVHNSVPPGHVIIYPVVERSARIYKEKRKPWNQRESTSQKKHSKKHSKKHAK